MNGLLHTLALLAGAFCLGFTCVVSLLFSIAARRSGETGESCLGKLLAAGGLMLAALFFYLGLLA